MSMAHLPNQGVTEFGFNWGAARIVRCCSDKKKGWVLLLLETPKHKESNAIQIYVTKTGKVRIYGARGEWKEQAK